MRIENDLAEAVVDSALRVHTELGPGLLESVYETVLAHELSERGFRVERQKSVPIPYKGALIENAFRIGLFVEERVIVEVKSVDSVGPLDTQRVLTYLRLTDKRLGLVINFNVLQVEDGIFRIENGMEEGSDS